MIGLDWIGFLEREKEKRDGTQVNEGEQHERTNERRHFSAFVSWSFLRRQRPESVDQKQRTESRTFPNFTAGHKGKKILRQKKDAQRHADTCICMCVCTHTHTHTQRERFAHHVVSFLLFLRASCVKNNVRGSIPNYCMNFEYTIYHNLLIKLKTLLLLLLLLL